MLRISIFTVANKFGRVRKLLVIVSKFFGCAERVLTYHSSRRDAVHVNPGAEPDGGGLVGVLWAAGQL